PGVTGPTLPGVTGATLPGPTLPGVTGVTGANREKIDLVRQVDDDLRRRQEYAGTSLVKIKEYCDIKSNKELFDIIVVIENYPLDKQLTRKKDELSVETYSITERTNFDLTVGITLFEGIEINITYDKKLFEEESIVRLTRHFKNILQDIINSPRQPVSTVKMMSDEEIKQLLVEFNDTAADYPRDKTIHRLFEEQVEKTPDNIGLVGSRQPHPTAYRLPPTTSLIQLTYRELNEKANRLTRHLQSKGVEPGIIVAIMVERSIEMI
ncbi:MAG: AMP-binding protein, partial [bacterium]|nr:AMP-binding protein [bacterium]